MFRLISIDLETCHADASHIKKAQALIERDEPNPRLKDPKKIKENLEKIEDDYQKKCQTIVDKSALLDAAPLGCIGCVADGRPFHFSTFRFSETEERALLQQGIFALTFENERSMMAGFSRFLEQFSDENTVMAGHNAEGFDYPKLRLACDRNRVQVPALLRRAVQYFPFHRRVLYDTMVMFSSSRTVEGNHKKFISLEAVCERLHLPYQKSMSGAEIPNAIARGEFLRVTIDCIADCYECDSAFRLLHGGIAA